ncbi:MAG: OsmC family protein [Chloroflexota bacterium]
MTETNHAVVTPRFHVEVKRTSGQMARAEAHGQTLDLAIKGGDPTLGFTAPEALLASFGACILSGITRDAAERGLRVDHAEVVFDGVKHIDPLGIDPLGIDPLSYRVVIHSPEPAEMLQDLYHRATTDGAATNALLGGISPTGELVIESAGTEAPTSGVHLLEGAAR